MRRWVLIGVDLEEKPDSVESFMAWLRIGCKVSTGDRFVAYCRFEPRELEGCLSIEKARQTGGLPFRSGG